MTVSIIGGSGFIGSRLGLRLCNTPTPFYIVDKVSSQTFPDLTRLADVRSVEALRGALESDTILVNLAAEHRDDVNPRTLYDEVNVEGARNLCTVAREKSVTTIIFTSSVAIYGFAPLGTDESGRVQPFNDYGRTKFAAEEIFREWQSQEPSRRSLTIVRPTVVFGEQNRGNVYNLLRQIASGRFLMVGSGTNRKSMAYVENVAAFIEYAMDFPPGVHVYNYVDKPDFTMNDLVSTVRSLLGRSTAGSRQRIPYVLGLVLGWTFDLAAKLSGRKFAISAIRVKKFCADSVYRTAVDTSGFTPPVAMDAALRQTVLHEFVSPRSKGQVFYSE